MRSEQEATTSDADELTAAQHLYDQALAAQAQYRFAEFGELINRTRDVVARAEPAASSADHDRWRELRIRVAVTWSWHAFDAQGLPAALAALTAAEAEATEWEREDLLGAVLFQRASVLSRGGDHAAAVDVARRAAGHRAGMPLDSQAKVTLNWALLESWAGNLPGAVARNEEASELARRAGLPNLQFMALHNGGYMEFLRGNLPHALVLMERADAMDVDTDRSVARLDHARALLDAGLLDEAREMLRSAAGLCAANGSDHDVAESELETARCELLRGNPDAARDWARQARRRFAARKEPGWRVRALLAELDALAELPGTVRRRARLAAALHAASTANGDTLAAEQAGLAWAEALLDSGDPQAAAPWAAAAPLRDSPQITTRLHYGLAAAKHALAAGDADAARDELTAAARALAAAQRESASIDLRTALSGHGQRLAQLDCRLAVERGDAADVLERVDRWRGALRGQASVRAPSDPREAELLARLRNLRDEARIAQGDDLARVQRETDEVARRIREFSWRAAAQGERDPAGSFSIDAVTAAVRERSETLLVLAQAGDAFERVEVTPAGDLRLHPGVPVAAVLEATRRVRADLTAASRLPEGHPLSGAIHASLTRGLSTLDGLLLPAGFAPGRFVVAPPSQLNLVPWGMLPRLRQMPVTVAATVTDWADSAHVVVAPRVTAVAGPDLPEADAEVSAVSVAWPGSRAIAAADSTGRGLIAALTGSDLVHVAAHGEHRAENPLFSSLRLGDGVLFAHEFEGQALRVSLAVLSACDAGRVTPRAGDEGLGLAASLRELGVGTVVAPLTPVPDRLSREIMDDLHTRLAAGLDTSAAVAAAGAGKGILAASFTTFGRPWKKSVVSPVSGSSVGALERQG
ncbi:CHAT domain-containing protein [Propionicicella superfundia]|uniref:CHAT domain-containing protein n=1 Tax=Propionicicella superfundia TaxID=348582 RepID=UPI000407267E|nr:CHAT domain-containing protein [Propionicicella superfundia]